MAGGRDTFPGLGSRQSGARCGLSGSGTGAGSGPEVQRCKSERSSCAKVSAAQPRGDMLASWHVGKGGSGHKGGSIGEPDSWLGYTSSGLESQVIGSQVRVVRFGSGYGCGS